MPLESNAHYYHILLTGICNQNCPFCYAGRIMKSEKARHEMSPKDLETLLKNLVKESGNKYVKIMGGEPTLHSRFGEMMDILFKYAPNASLFTNGLFNDKIVRIIKRHVPNLKLAINIMTPAFQLNQKKREEVTERIRELAPLTMTVLSVIVHPATDVSAIMATVDKEAVRYVTGVRIGALNPIMGEKNTYAFTDFFLIGQKVREFMNAFLAIKPTMRFQLDCGFTRCMFSKDQIQFLEKHNIHYSWGCFQGGFMGCLDVKPDMRAISCYSLSEAKNIHILRKGISAVERSLFLQQVYFQNKYVLETCRKCVFRTDKNPCRGPCIGYKINALHKEDKPFYCKKGQL